jgi:hypothetical protein
MGHQEADPHDAWRRYTHSSPSTSPDDTWPGNTFSAGLHPVQVRGFYLCAGLHAEKLRGDAGIAH